MIHGVIALRQAIESNRVLVNSTCGVIPLVIRAFLGVSALAPGGGGWAGGEGARAAATCGCMTQSELN